MKISSRMMINEGVVELEYLARTAQGVLVVTPSDENIIFDYIARNDLTSAVNHLNTLTSIYYDFYLGIAKQSEAEVKLFETIYQFGLQNKVKMVALHKSCYLRK